METKGICLDTSILIDYYRKKEKSKSVFFGLTKRYNLFSVSIITEYEIMIGAKPEQVDFWHNFFDRVTVLPFTKEVNDTAIAVTQQLKAVNKLIEIPDIFIGATALAHQMPLATLNVKHFERIDGLSIVS